VIFRAAGPIEKFAACRALGGCLTGDVKVTPGFNLIAKVVIHAVGPKDPIDQIS
jgi:O-acetyl-ADP-ribose deacetylase (regulator of RNase III)